MEEWQNKLIEQAGPLGAALGVVIIAAGAVVAKAKGWFMASEKSDAEPKPRGNANEEVMAGLHEINERLGLFDHRISDLERDLASRPTSADIAEVQKSIAVMGKSIEHVGEKIGATGAAVTRIEDFLISLSKRKN